MAGLPDARLVLWDADTPIYRMVAAAASDHRLNDHEDHDPDPTDFRKALDGVVGARNREATRQIARRHEYQLIGADHQTAELTSKLPHAGDAKSPDVLRGFCF